MKKILLVDNDRFILEVLKDLLTQKGCQVVTAEDGLSALDALETFTPDTIFVDMVMPNIDGKRLCKILRKMENLKDTYIVSLSATAREDFGDIADLGIDASIAKGPLEEMGREVLGVLDQPRSVSSRLVSGTSPGPKEIQQRTITKELLSGLKRFEVILAQMNEGIFEIASDGRIVYANRGASFLTGLPDEDILGRGFPELFAKEDRQRVREFLEGAQGVSMRLSEDHPPTLNAYKVTMDVHFIPESDGKAIVILNNVSEQKKAEKALKKSEERYRLLFENANEAIFITQEGIVKFPNRRTVEILGFNPEELAEVSFVDLVHPEERDSVREKYKKSLGTEAFPSTYSFRVLNRSGEELWVELNSVLIRWEQRPAILNFLRDITEKKRLEIHLQQSQRMASIGTLAGGIAHDFNNLLMAIQANASLVLLKKDPNSPDYTRLKNIEQYVQNGAALTRHLLDFAREGKYEPKPTDLNELLRQTVELFVRTKKEITAYPKYQEGILTVEVDKRQIDQVLMSLYINAWEAMPEGGKVFRETENVRLGRDFVISYGVEPGMYVKISISDTGVGMDAKTRERIFDPFFTTKAVKQGAGLGLAAAYGIIKNHGGIMDVRSEKGKGSTFNIYLPASKRKP